MSSWIGAGIRAVGGRGRRGRGTEARAGYHQEEDGGLHRRFNTGDAGSVTALYEDTATVEDPAGSAPHKGSQAIRQFYDKVCGHGARLEPVSFNPAPDGSGALFFQVKVKTATINVIDVMTFDDAGKIASMKAYSAFTQPR